MVSCILETARARARLPRIKGRRGTVGFCALFWGALLTLSACESTPDGRESPPDAGVESSPCGRGPISLELGRGRPMERLPEPLTLPMEYGLQGGYHVDLSLAFSGAFDPDLVSLRLLVEDGDGWRIGEHFTADWYLLFGEKESIQPACFFYQARLFLYEPDGSLPQEETIEALADREEMLQIELLEQDGTNHRFERQLIFRLDSE